jgi:hypothetical protein
LSRKCGGLISTFGFHKRQGISWLAERLAVSQEGLRFMGLVSTGTEHSDHQLTHLELEMKNDENIKTKE